MLTTPSSVTERHRQRWLRPLPGDPEQTRSLREQVLPGPDGGGDCQQGVSSTYERRVLPDLDLEQPASDKNQAKPFLGGGGRER